MKVHIKKKGKVHTMNFSDKAKIDIMDVKADLFQRRKLIERQSFVSINETSMIF